MNQSSVSRMTHLSLKLCRSDILQGQTLKKNKTTVDLRCLVSVFDLLTKNCFLSFDKYSFHFFQNLFFLGGGKYAKFEFFYEYYSLKRLLIPNQLNTIQIGHM